MTTDQKMWVMAEVMAEIYGRRQIIPESFACYFVRSRHGPVWAIQNAGSTKPDDTDIRLTRQQEVRVLLVWVGDPVVPGCSVDISYQLYRDAVRCTYRTETIDDSIQQDQE